MSFASTTTAVCTAASTVVTLVATGTCSIVADVRREAHWNYRAAAPVTRSFTGKSGLADRLRFGPLKQMAIESGCWSNYAGGDGQFWSAGWFCVQYEQCLYGCGQCGHGDCDGNLLCCREPGRGNAMYAPATSVAQSFTVSSNSQTITFAQLSNVNLGSGAVTLAATASSGLAVTFSFQYNGRLHRGGIPWSRWSLPVTVPLWRARRETRPTLRPRR